MRACNCCNQLMEEVGYCTNCLCPESRELKDQRIFLTMDSDKQVLIEAIQAACAEDFVQRLIKVGTWEFEVEIHKGHGWYCAYMTAPFEVWMLLNQCKDVSVLREWLDERIDVQQASD